MSVLTKLLPRMLDACGKIVVDAIKQAIRSGLFSKPPFGAALKEETIRRRTETRTQRYADKRAAGGELGFTIKRNVAAPLSGHASNLALIDTGAFVNGMKWHRSSNTEGTVSSDGKSDAQQNGFVLGHAKGHPSNDGFVPGGRNPFRKDLPAAKGRGLGSNTVEAVCIATASAMMIDAAQKEMNRVIAATNRRMR